MTEYLIAAWLVATSLLDAVRDKTKNEDHTTIWKRPFFHIGRRPVDLWHIVKWLAFYPPLIYIWSGLWPNLLLMGLTAGAAALAWKAVPSPEHWKR